jgi:hypothetical protein
VCARVLTRTVRAQSLPLKHGLVPSPTLTVTDFQNAANNLIREAHATPAAAPVTVPAQTTPVTAQQQQPVQQQQLLQQAAAQQQLNASPVRSATVTGGVSAALALQAAELPVSRTVCVVCVCVHVRTVRRLRQRKQPTAALEMTLNELAQLADAEV